MMTEVQATSSSGSLLSLSLSEVSSGIIVKDIQGLGPVKATIVSTSAPGHTGDIYMASKREARDLVFSLGLEPDYISEMPQDVRSRLYDFFMSNTWVDLTFVDSVKNPVNITGLVESCEPDIFSQEPAMNVSVRCFDSDFVDPSIQAVYGFTTTSPVGQTITYNGSVETGVQFQLTVDRDIDEFTLYHTLPNGESRQLDFAWPLHAGDNLRIDSQYGKKGVTLTRGGADTSLLYAMSPQSSWIEFQKGDNIFRAYAEGAAIPYDLAYYNRYGGL